MEEYWIDEFSAHLRELQKAVYEFSQGGRYADDQKMEDEKKAIFAMIDALMLEYCPDEMSPDQIAEWECCQKVAPGLAHPVE